MEPLSTSVHNGSINTGKGPDPTRKKVCSKRKRPGVLEEEEKEKEEEKMEKSCGDDRDRNNGISFEIDHKVLDCPVCHKPLQPPIFECLDGHVACSSCCDKLQKVCQVCSLSTGCNRCRALESVIESIKVSCSYFRFGCKETLSYTEKHIHEESCPHAPCYCPIQECTFHGTTQGLSDHFSAQHRYGVETFHYSRRFTVVFRPTTPFRVLRGEDGGIFLLLNGRDIPSGNSISLACIRPGSTALDLEYKLEVISRGKGNRLCLEGSPICIRQWRGDYPTKCFLYVLQEFCWPLCFPMDVEIRQIIPSK